MLLLSKVIHVMALGLWFGSVVFFSLIVAPNIFSAFGSLPTASPDQRPAWLPTNFQNEQATQLAGIAIGPIFPWYFLIQGICGLFVVATALNWARLRLSPAVHKIRFYLTALALLTVLASWPLAQKVEVLRMARYSLDTSVAEPAKQSFASWHVASLLLNFVTLVFVTGSMALAAWLPSLRSEVSESPGNDAMPAEQPAENRVLE